MPLPIAALTDIAIAAAQISQPKAQSLALCPLTTSLEP